jgi:phosphatidylserine/phosphatidylglycerophosphate/cardiolipin synthase-like enzyme
MEDGTIISSTHAKLIIADYDLAYIGSAELRRNSLVTNFEIGCLIRGSQVFGICEVFDFIFSRGRIWK